MDVQDSDTICIEVQVTSEENYAILQNDSISPYKSPKQGKRKVKDALLNDASSSKRCRKNSSSQEISVTQCANGTKNLGNKPKRQRKSRKKNEVDHVELKNVLDGMDDEIVDVLEESSLKNSLSTANVKHILRHVITNEYVLAMVRNTMKADNNELGDLEEAAFEPKLTRSKVKELREKQHVLPWPISTPIKQPETSKSLLDEEFSDESSSDEDYKPNEEECHSEEDILTMSPKSGDLDSSFCEKAPSPEPKAHEDDAEDEDALVIALPETELETEAALGETGVDKIALRTRSKLPLNDTPLELIEASFIAPDITMDMYDTQCDNEEWQTFLHDLSKPLGTFGTIEKPDEEPDDGDDPEYNFLEEEDVPDEIDLRFDNNKVPREELNALMAEIMEAMQYEMNDDEEEEEDTETPGLDTSNVEESLNAELNKCTDPFYEEPSKFVESSASRTEYMILDERLQLDEQMRMYIQLLTQSYLLSFGVPDLDYISFSSKLFLDEIKMYDTKAVTPNERSAFAAHNLDEALSIVNNFDSGKVAVPVRPITWANSKKPPGIKSIQIKKTIFNSKVFMYPELLPVCSYFNSLEQKKAIFTAAEDRLIALGLEQFSFSQHCLYYVNTLLVPTKTEDQIKLHIKNTKCSKKVTLQNPIKYFCKYKRSPPIQRFIQPFDPNNVKAPCDYSPEYLPKWMSSMFNATVVPASVVPILPKSMIARCSQPKKIKGIPKLRTVTPVKKFKTLLPRIVQSSPLKQISPILKKYNQKRLILPKQAAVKDAPTPTKCVQFAKRLITTSSVPQTISSSVNTHEKNVHDDVEEVRPNESENTEVINTNSGLISQDISDSTKQAKNYDMAVSESTINVTVTDGSATEIVDCDEEEVDEPEIIKPDAASVNNSTNKKPATKKKNKMQRDLESTLVLLEPNLLEKDPKKEEREALFANSYLLRATEALKDDPDTSDKFIQTLCKYRDQSKSPTELYFKIKEILKDYPSLVDDFVAFLRPEQAKECGKYKEYVVLYKIRQFVRKVEVHFQNQPQHLLKILRTFAQFKQQSRITSAEVLSTLQPLLKNQRHLIEELNGLLPDVSPPEYLMTDFEDITIPNSDDDNSSIDSCEEITIPDTPDPYGGKDCPCSCHTSSNEAKFINRVRHCVKCGIKFMDGRIYIQTGKVLKPAQVIYHGEVPPEPVKIANTEMKTTKSRHSSSNTKNSATAEQSVKSDAKKDHAIPNPMIPQPPPSSTEKSVPSTSKLPCDVIEDTVFPTVTSCSNKKSAPSDFSQLKDILSQSSHNRKESADGTGNAGSYPAASPKKDVWSKEEDKVIIYNFTRFGTTDKSFETSASILQRPKEKVQERCKYILNLVAKEMKL